jgi:hypothetical protein
LYLHLLHLAVHGSKASRWGLRVIELRCAIGRGRNERLVKLRRHLLNGAVHTLLLLLLLLLLIILLLLERSVVLELRTRECSRRTGLERRAEEELRWEQGSELHVEPRSRCCHLILPLLIHRLCINRRNVRSTRVSVSISAHRKVIRTVCTMGEASIAIRRFRGMSRESASGGRARPVLGVCYLGFLHPEKMRWQDKAVPH